MREYKFRAWIYNEITEENEMCYDLAFDEYAPINDLLASVKNLMQYTGLKDKNGREIYEGDILLQKTTPQFKKYNPYQWERRYIVKFGYHDVMPHHADGVALGWTLVEVVRGYRKAIGDLEIDNQTGNYPYEIIGNIYESPELLEVEK